jgi:alkanesulfonate monooxygenase SsuD/methylene tetrahydromethanopterin reductase-like flavin-dependent oxidoreductase (luciferase family)
MPAALALLDELHPGRFGLRLVAGGPGEVGAEQRVDEIPDAAALLAPVDGAYGLQLEVGHARGS